MPTDVLYAIIGVLLTIIGFFIAKSLSKVDSVDDFKASISSLEANMEATYARILEMAEQAKSDIKDLEKLNSQVAVLASKLEAMRSDLDKMDTVVTEAKVTLAVCKSKKDCSRL